MDSDRLLAHTSMWKQAMVVFMALLLLGVFCACAEETQDTQRATAFSTENAYTFYASILEVNDTNVLVAPLTDSELLRSSDRLSFGTTELEKIDVAAGDVVQIAYTGDVMETDPAQIKATSWQIANDLRHLEYTQQWVDRAAAEEMGDLFLTPLRITKIYSNCFFAVYAYATPEEFKLNGTLSEEWCVGDLVACTTENAFFDGESNHVEAELRTIEASDWKMEPDVDYKPVIYLYPEEETEVSVKLTLDGRLTCTYPSYRDGWSVTAQPDGTLTDANGQTYNYLFWEGETYADYDLSRGFCVKGEETAAFLENALSQLGLTRREANEFIVYWLPLMEGNPYNIISFQTDVYTEAAKLEVQPAPDTLIRVFMAWRAADSFLELPEQELMAPERAGFTVVEWGGTKLK